jgi:[glutamine synthetase] adenylyltransferase / [glutamine synthetase]-adenylyl-L-tyrosine phosphorylase
MVKVRQVAGDFKTGAQLMSMFKPFVYRRYLDFGAIEELRILKYKITQELQRKDRMENIKLGPGGIREIEFIGQVFQLIRGGQEKSLQQREILNVLETLADLSLMSQQDSQLLQSSYKFLRKVENHIQQYQDKQTHDLPDDTKIRDILAYSMGFSSWREFKVQLDLIRHQVHTLFDQVFSLSKQEVKPQTSFAVWSGNGDSQLLISHLQAMRFVEPESIFQALQIFKKSAAIRHLTAKGAGVMDRLMPQLLDAMQTVGNPDITLKRLLNLFEEVAGRNVYLSLLEENPQALNQLVKLSSASIWICEYLSRYPALFDELLDARSLYEPLKKQDLQKRLHHQLQSVDVNDIEQFMIALRKFKHTHVLKVAAADIMGVIPLMVVSDYLTYIAEVLVEQTVEYAWQALGHKHGFPPDATDQVSNFAVIGLGKLGGLELSYSSDLDMVFLYNCQDNMVMTVGAKPITCAQFYLRLGQQVRHIMETRMLSGILYEVDLRLRPNGDSGLLATKIAAYENYLLNEAWTWEHQALVRARFIAGDLKIKQVFENVRSRVLCLERNYQELKVAVREMREKMRNTLTVKEPGKFDLKQSKGGIADIEFIVQFGILAHAFKNASLTTYTDNVRLLEALQEDGFISQAVAHILKSAYCLYRDYGHKSVLQGDLALVDESEITEIRMKIEAIWDELMH